MYSLGLKYCYSISFEFWNQYKDHLDSKFLLKIYSISKAGLQRKKETEIFPLLVPSPNGHSSQRPVSPKPGARISSRSHMWVQGPNVLGHLPTAFPCYQQGAELEVKQLGLKLVPRWDAGATGA